MPDYERLTDTLREHLVEDNPQRLAFEKGYTLGKTKARIEILVVTVIIALTACVIYLIT